jgi:hypothetical protein
VLHARDAEESDTNSTDSDKTWGGLGMFEYSYKVIPHALMHAKETVMRGGHHGAYCTSLAETCHKNYIKMASLYARTYASRNKTQDHMLTWVCRQKVWDAVARLLRELKKSADDEGDADDSTVEREHRLQQPVALTHDWLPLTRRLTAQALRIWGSTLLSEHVLISRAELMSLLRKKLNLRDTRANNNRLLEQLHLRFYGVFVMETQHGFRRRFVGQSSISKGRRDFVRMQGMERGTALSAQVKYI